MRTSISRALSFVMAILATAPAVDARRRSVASVQPPWFRSITPMSEARAVLTATGLFDGRVLIVGGFGSSERAVAGAEFFDPVDDRFTPAPPMRTRRQSHSATRLSDGRVLIIGGYESQARVVASAEIFDPASEAFVAAGSLATARAGHEAVLMADGRVLITGGVGSNGGFLDSTEVYDPFANRFSSGPRMAEARESHASILLQDGRVLIAGGHRRINGAIRPLASAEIYDPAARRFDEASSMTIVRHKHDALLLPDGRVLILGGADERDDRGIYRSVEIFDPVSQRFASGAPLLRQRYKHRGTSLLLENGHVLLAGGSEIAEIYDPDSGRARPIRADALLSGQFSAAAALPDGRVLLVGGYGGGRGPTSRAWVLGTR